MQRQLSRGSWRVASALVLLAFSPRAFPAPLLRPADAPTPGSSASAAAAARAAQMSQAAVRQASESLRRASQALQRFRDQQDVARAAAAAAASVVPNGLTAGGLEIAPGANTNPDLWAGARMPTQSAEGQLSNVSISQTDPKAILSWKTFNVGRETNVHFDQTAGGADAPGWIALNRVSDPNARPSQILGSIRAEGQLYLINPNGIVFGGTSQVNVGSVIASSLDFYGATLAERNQRFRDGILFNPNESIRPALVFGENLAIKHDGSEIFPQGDGVTIEAGAQLTANGGRAMILGHNVVNAGTIQATDGEAVLAAGRGIYLNKNYPRGFTTGPALSSEIRGLTVGVDRGGRVENSGIISSDRGSINIQGKSIFQGGLLQATTGATANGYINLTAGDAIRLADLTSPQRRPYPDPFFGGAFGDLTFGEASTTQILPDSSGQLAVGFDQFKPSRVEVFGRYLTFQNNATLFAPGASVTVDALPGPAIQGADDSRIYLGGGARIDVSGLRGIELPIERNTIKAEVRAIELADNPLLRDSFLRGQTVYFDARQGTSVVNLSGYYDLISRSVPELMTQGGSLTLDGSQIITRAGSTIDLGGGSLTYLPGYVRSTRLVDQFGNVVPIEQADPNLRYVGFAGDHLVDHARWGLTEHYSSPFLAQQGTYQAGYVEGRAAGTLTIGGQPDSYWLDPSNRSVYTPTDYGYRILDGNIEASVVVGPNQRAAPTGATAKDVTRVWREVPAAATLNFGYRYFFNQDHPENPGGVAPIGGNIAIDQAPFLPEDFAFNSRIDPSAAYNNILPARYFDGRTFGNVNLYSGTVGAEAVAPGGLVTLREAVIMDLGNYGRLNVNASRVDIDGTIRAAGGSVNITAAMVAPSLSGSPPDWRTLDPDLKPRINLGPTGVIDLAGRWVNLLLNPADRPQLSINGGSVSLVTSNNLSLAAGSLIDVSGGGRLSADGRKVTAGKAGSVSLVNSVTVFGAIGVPPGPRDGVMNLAGTLGGYGLQAGGSLSIATGKSLLITDRTSAGANGLVLAPDFFRAGGFASYSVSGAAGARVDQGTVIAPEVQSFLLDRSAQSIATGSRLFGTAQLAVFSGDLAQPMSLTLSAPAVNANGDLLYVSQANWTPLFTENNGAVIVDTGAQIRMAPKSTLRLVGLSNIFVDGTISTPSGLIELRIGLPPGDVRAVRLGENARLLAQGYLKSTLQGLFTQRSVEAAGQVRIGSFSIPGTQPGAVGFVVTDPGSVLDVSGVQGVADLNFATRPLTRPATPYVERLVDGAAGSITIAMGGGQLGGQLRLDPGGASGQGGSLEFDAPRITVTQSVPNDLRVTRNSPIDPSNRDGLTVYADRVNASGTDDLILKPTGLVTVFPRELVFDGDVSLSTRRSIQVGGPLIAVKPESAGRVSLSSGYVAFNSRTDPSDTFIDSPGLATDLAGSLTVNAGTIDIAGYGVDFGCSSGAECTRPGLTKTGFADVRLVSSGDIRLQTLGRTNGDARISTGGTLTLEAAQVYVTSAPTARAPYNGGDPGFLINAGSSVRILGNGAPAPVPYSYGERLTIRSPEITQAGVLRAPLGEIHLEGGRSVTLARGSLTSTSLEGLRLIGSVANINPDNPFPNLVSPLAAVGLASSPSKTVDVKAPNVTVGDGATLDVSGGGDVSAWQFVGGTGGSRNILRDSGVFAVLPGYGEGPLPAGWQSSSVQSSFYASSVPRVGDRIHLEGVPGLPAGNYTLLPADYARLPGGLLVRAVGSGLAQAPVTTVRPDGSSVVAGYRLVDRTPIHDAGYARFLVMPQSVFGKYSTFADYSFNDFVATQSEQSGVIFRAGLDAGSVVLAATNNLVLNGTGRFGAVGAGLLGNLDISSTRIAVVGGGSAPPTGYLAVDANAVSRFGAGSVLIGGTRAQGADGTHITINATNVIVSNDSSSPLTGPEILLGAQDTLTVARGSVINAQGRPPGDANSLVISNGSTGEPRISNGAFLRLSTGSRVAVTRTNADGSSGVLDIRRGATLESTGALTFEASNNVLLDPSAAFDAAQVDVSSRIVSIGDVPGSVNGTILSGATLARLANATDLLIRGSQSIDFYGTFHLGGRDASGIPTLGALTLDTRLLNGFGTAADTASVVARSLTLRGGDAIGPSAGNLTLVLQTNNLILGPGNLAIDGFANINVSANAVQANGSGALRSLGSMSVSTDLLTAAAGSDYAVSVGGDLSVVRANGPTQSANDFGGRLSLTASNLRLDTTVDMPAGIFEAHAVAGDLTLGSAALLRLRGRAVDFRDLMRAAPGGVIRLNASGNVSAASGAQLDISGDARGGDAGWIEVSAGNAVSLAGQLKGAGAAGYRGAGFSLDANSISNFDQLNAALEAGGLNRARAIHVMSGDLVLGSGQVLTAHDVLLRSDTGSILIAGTINAAGDRGSPSGGQIRLLGGNGISLAGSARLDAHVASNDSNGFPPDSGSVEIAATGGRVSVATGAVVDISGGKQGGGKVWVRAPRDGTHDVAIDRLEGQFIGARDLAIIGVNSLQTTNVDEAERGAVLEDARTWMLGAPETIHARLGASAFEVRPGISVKSPGDLAISTDIDLSSERYGPAGTPGYLELNAVGDININANLSDGFAGTAAAAALNTGRSWSYALEAGRDVRLSADKLVRTGTGDIRVKAGLDLILTNNFSVLYTAGTKTPTDDGFRPPDPRYVLGEFPTQGGEISLTAGRDIVAPVTRQAASAWLFRYGDTDWRGDPRRSPVAEQTSWSIVFANFQQGVGALGGGNVSVSAGRDIAQLAVSLPTTGHLATDEGRVAQEGDVHIRGGGNLTLRAGRDLIGGVFMLGQGAAEMNVGGRLTNDPSTLVPQRPNIEGNQPYALGTLAPLFGLADATLTVNARTGAEVEAAFDPMLQGQICPNTLCSYNQGRVTNIGHGSAFYGMTERTAIRVTSVTGDVRYDNNPWASVDVSHDLNRPAQDNPLEAVMFVSPEHSGLPTTTGVFGRAPGTMQLAALHNDVVLANKRSGTPSLTLAPTNNGTFDLVAQNALRGEGANFTNFSVAMMDIAADYRRGARDAFRVDGDTSMELRINLPTPTTNFDRGFTPTHLNDAIPARLYSMTQSMPSGTSIAVPKALSVYSARDLPKSSYTVQNNRPSDVSSFVAERDAIDLAVVVKGIGDLVVEAGRDIKITAPSSISGARIIASGDDTPSSAGAGSLPTPDHNPALSAKQGANLYMFSGSARDTDYNGFNAAYLDPQNSSHVVRTYLAELRSYMSALGFTGLSDDDLIARFQTLSLQSRKAFADQILFTELKETGLDVTDANGARFQNYNRGYEAIKRLFPRDTAQITQRDRSNILLNTEKVETWAGGNITMVAPYGRVEIGGPAVGSAAENGGVITRKGGSIRIMADQNIDLFSSRAFTLLGGDITIWSSNGDITAGVGAKTTVFRPPLQYTLDNDGRVALNVFGLQTGAGIGVLSAGGTGERAASRLDLIAPRGEVNAGDAGIRVVGDVNIAALRVVGVENIQVSGTSTGVPKVAAPDIALLTETDKVLSAATEKLGPASQPRTKPEELPSIVTVEVIGYETPSEGEPPQPERRNEPNGGEEPRGRNR